MNSAHQEDILQLRAALERAEAATRERTETMRKLLDEAKAQEARAEGAKREREALRANAIKNGEQCQIWKERAERAEEALEREKDIHAENLERCVDRREYAERTSRNCADELRALTQELKHARASLAQAREREDEQYWRAQDYRVRAERAEARNAADGWVRLTDEGMNRAFAEAMDERRRADRGLTVASLMFLRLSTPERSGNG